MASPSVWAVHDGKVGMANQVIGLAEALGYPFVEKRLAIRGPWRHLTPPLWIQPLAALGPEGDRLAPPWPDVLIAVGRLTTAPALAAKRASGGRIFWVEVQDPRYARREVDLIVAPAHDPATGDNVFPTLGAVHRVTAARLSAGAAALTPRLQALPRPLVTVLLGGANRVYRATEALFATLLDQLAALAEAGYGLAITPSRRTGPAHEALLRQRLAGYPAYIWDGAGDNPYFGLLGLADAVLVTADSISMVSEAAATGKPVHVIDLEGGSAKFSRFHRALRDAGITRPFTGAIESWRYDPPDDTARAAAEIRRRLALRLAEVA
ncbi:MAG TPA: mitochondrial fission ELM1 family protein [Stellaceae bacterium]|nr:mitochondrial fission ELM1 family protein [Stellaceae bacterium]